MEKILFNKKDIKKLRQFILTRVKSQEDAEEIWQETLISAYQSFPTFKKQSSLSSWFCGIAKHEIADFYRKKKIKTILFSRLPFLEGLADQALGPQEQLIEAELKRKVRKVYKSLSEGYRVVLRLKYIDEHSVAETARKLGLSLKAAESRLTRARLAFRQAWMEENAKIPLIFFFALLF